MASATLNWTPAGGSSSGQRVEYRVKSVGGSWTVFATLSSSANTATVTGLTDNTIYEFRIVNICSGTDVPATVVEGVKQTCVVPSNSVTATSCTVTFPHLGGEVSKYNIKIYTTIGNTLVSSVDKTGPFTIGSNVSHTFSGLTSGTSYYVNITPYVSTYSLTNCASFDIVTTAPSCNAPTSVTATLS